jgi:hypothetical protein
VGQAPTASRNHSQPTSWLPNKSQRLRLRPS